MLACSMFNHPLRTLWSLTARICPTLHWLTGTQCLYKASPRSTTIPLSLSFTDIIMVKRTTTTWYLRHKIIIIITPLEEDQVRFKPGVPADTNTRSLKLDRLPHKTLHHLSVGALNIMLEWPLLFNSENTLKMLFIHGALKNKVYLTLNNVHFAAFAQPISPLYTASICTASLGHF